MSHSILSWGEGAPTNEGPRGEGGGRFRIVAQAEVVAWRQQERMWLGGSRHARRELHGVAVVWQWIPTALTPAC